MNQEALQALWLGPEVSLDAAGVDLDEHGTLRFLLRQCFTYLYAGPVFKVDQHLIVVPPPRHGAQRTVFHLLSVSGGEGQPAWSRDSFGNSVARVHVPAVNEALEFQVDVVVDRSGQDLVRLPAVALDDSRYLDTTRLTAPDAAITAAARDAVGVLRPGLEAAERLCDAAHEALHYQRGVTTIATTAVAAFALGAGVCQDHAHLMLAMSHAIGLPARYVSGHMLGEGSTHAWVEVLVPDTDDPGAARAVAFDPCHARRTDATYVTVAVGRDYADVAPTSGTYRGRFANQLTSTTRLGVIVGSRSVDPS